eukprot:m.19306 g.19306  ORF g.19306 m.19306 type:complete len:53 (+) comp12403_c0_seq1:399-557(+)
MASCQLQVSVWVGGCFDNDWLIVCGFQWRNPTQVTSRQQLEVKGRRGSKAET